MCKISYELISQSILSDFVTHREFVKLELTILTMTTCLNKSFLLHTFPQNTKYQLCQFCMKIAKASSDSN